MNPRGCAFSLVLAGLLWAAILTVLAIVATLVRAIEEK
jgi:hypothetical protein